MVVELGSGFCYSAYWFAKAVISGKVVLPDYREENIEYAKNLFRETGVIRQAEFRIGDAVEIAKEYNSIDILLIDIDKHQYLEAVRELMPHLSPNAIIIADNTFWYGRVAEKIRDNKTREIRKFNKYLFEHPDFITVILPLKDGVLVSSKCR